MKVLALLTVLFGMVCMSAGCADPAYSASERHAQIMRNWSYESKQITDDWDSFWMLRPASHLTIWNLQ